MILRNYWQSYRYQKLTETYQKIVLSKNLTYRPPLPSGEGSSHMLWAYPYSWTVTWLFPPPGAEAQRGGNGPTQWQFLWWLAASVLEACGLVRMVKRGLAGRAGTQWSLKMFHRLPGRHCAMETERLGMMDLPSGEESPQTLDTWP